MASTERTAVSTHEGPETQGEPGTAASRSGRTPPVRYDLVVLGDTLAGIAAAREAARIGGRIALVKSEEAAGPPPEAAWALEHALRHAAHTVWRRSGGTAAGDRASGPPIDFPAILRWAEQLRLWLHPDDALEQLAELGVEIYAGPAAFVRPDRLEIGHREIGFHRAVLATGTRPAPPPIEGAKQACCLTAAELGRLERPPERLAILGTGPRACQWAQTFCRLGSEVWLIGGEPALLCGEDPAAAAIVQEQLEKEGVRLQLGCQKVSVDRTGHQCVVILDRAGEREKRFCDHVLADAPRVASTAGLGLEAAGIAATDRGVAVDQRLRTSSPRVFAAGDVCGAEFFCGVDLSRPEVAEAMGRLAAGNAVRWWPRKLDPAIVPHYVFTDPAIARVGWTPGEAAARRIETETLRVDLADVRGPALEGDERGLVAVHVRRGTGRVLGACCVAEEAVELIAPLAVLIAKRMPLAALAEVIPCRPSQLDVLARIAGLHARLQRPTTWRDWLRRGRWRWRSLRSPATPADAEPAPPEIVDQW